MLFKSDSRAHVSTDARQFQGGGAAIVCCWCMCHPVLWITGKGQELGLGSSDQVFPWSCVDHRHKRYLPVPRGTGQMLLHVLSLLTMRWDVYSGFRMNHNRAFGGGCLGSVASALMF